jgi:AcrR family transcriptional regulator
MKEANDMPWNRFPEDTVKIILDAAMKLFQSKGYEETTILDIVGNMGGLSRGAFYHHFKSKEEVFFALADRMFFSFNPFAKAKDLSQLTGLEKIKWVMKTFGRNKEYYAMQIEMLPLLKSPTVFKKFIDNQRDNTAKWFCELIDEGMQDGSIQASNARLTAELFTMLVNVWLIPAIYPCASDEETWQKFEMAKGICAFMGLPVFDDELKDIYDENGYLTS